ncbi:hypothetical protein LZ023_38715 (plasmid) [Pseudomonas silvicola]|nr:hypothetical protein LZ023_38715 [Pseudomonas silvicola]
MFIPFGGNPLSYGFLFNEAFGSLRSLGLSISQATPLMLIALATIVVWRAGLGYIGFEVAFSGRCSSQLDRAQVPRVFRGPSPLLYWPMVLLAAFLAGAIWAGWVGALRVKFGGNDV